MSDEIKGDMVEARLGSMIDGVKDHAAETVDGIRARIKAFDASGTVYNLKSVAEFAGPYAQIRTGLAIGQFGKGQMTLRNTNDVVIRLSGTRSGLALSTGADAMVISFEK